MSAFTSGNPRYITGIVAATVTSKFPRVARRSVCFALHCQEARSTSFRFIPRWASAIIRDSGRQGRPKLQSSVSQLPLDAVTIFPPDVVHRSLRSCARPREILLLLYNSTRRYFRIRVRKIIPINKKRKRRGRAVVGEFSYRVPRFSWFIGKTCTRWKSRAAIAELSRNKM